MFNTKRLYTAILTIIAMTVMGSLSLAHPSSVATPLAGWWQSVETGKSIYFHKFENKFAGSTRSYYSDGSPSDYLFQFNLPKDGLKPNQKIQGKVLSLDGYYGCAFEENASLYLDDNNLMHLEYTLLRFHLRTTQQRSSIPNGWESIRSIDWTGWGWVEYERIVPIERWRTIKSECIIDQKTNYYQTLQIN